MRICLFDIDGTLIRSGGAGKQAFERALHQAFGVDATEQDVPFSGRTDRAIVLDLFSCFGIEATDTAWQRFNESYLQQLPECLAACEGYVLPGVVDLLEELGRSPSVATGLLTGNASEGARIKLDHYGLADHFHFGGYGDRHLDRNLVAHEAVAAARESVTKPFEAEQVYVIGDTPLDVRCGRAIGAQVIAVCTGGHTEEELVAAGPDMLLKDLTEYGTLLEVLFD